MTTGGGTYTTNGAGSPSIYSTANVTANDAKLISNTSEGILNGDNSAKNISLKLDSESKIKLTGDNYEEKHSYERW